MRPGALLPLLPWLGTAFFPAWTPSRALLLAWLLRAIFAAPGAVETDPPALGPRLRADLLLPGGAWLLFRFLRSDAPLGAGLVLLALSAATGRVWRRGRGLSLLALGVLLPPSIVALMALGGRPLPSALVAWEPWTLLGAPPPALAGTSKAERKLPDGVRVADLPLSLPTRLRPWALEDPDSRPRALLLLGCYLLLAAGSERTARAGRARGAWLGAGAALCLLPPAAWLGRAPAQQRILYRESGAAGRSLELLARRGGDYEALQGAFLPPSESGWELRPLSGGTYEVVGGGVWALVRPAEPGRLERLAAEPDLPWLEFQPLRAPRWGPEGGASSGALRLLGWWAAGDRPPDPGGARWELAADGTLLRWPVP